MIRPPYSTRTIASVALALVVSAAFSILVFTQIAFEERAGRSTQALVAEQVNIVHRMARFATTWSHTGEFSAPSLVALHGTFTSNHSMLAERLDQYDNISLARLQRTWERATALVEAAADDPAAAADNGGARELVYMLDQVLAALVTLDQGIYEAIEARTFNITHGHFATGLSMMLLVLLAVLLVANALHRDTEASEAAATARRRQSTLRLMKEMSGLAQGDLTVQATVSKDAMGAIAEMFNFAVQALRKLVSTIYRTAIKVDAAAHETRRVATELTEASARQGHEIESVNSAVQRIVSANEQVAANAGEARDIARQQVEIAGKGAQVVHSTIAGMSGIREQIQETSKRIKRLGESSQEIGDIVELINGIAEQTNILAMNAAIQASGGGDQGKGFGVVADEVQRLAERVTGATREIEALVQNIQVDTNEAVASMEQSTAGVVSGTSKAEDAGAALEEIERVAQRMLGMIEQIAAGATEQAQASAEAVAVMEKINAITEGTAADSDRVAEEVSKLAELAAQLHESAAGFNLPSSELTESGRFALDQLRKIAGERGGSGKQ